MSKKDSEKRHTKKSSPVKAGLMLLFVTIMGLVFLKNIVDFRFLAKKKGVKLREVSDLWYVLVFSIFHMVFSTCNNLGVEIDPHLHDDRKDHTVDQTGWLHR